MKCKPFVDSAGTKNASLEDKFLFRVFAAFNITLIEGVLNVARLV